MGEEGEALVVLSRYYPFYISPNFFLEGGREGEAEEEVSSR